MCVLVVMVLVPSSCSDVWGYHFHNRLRQDHVVVVVVDVVVHVVVVVVVVIVLLHLSRLYLFSTQFLNHFRSLWYVHHYQSSISDATVHLQQTVVMHDIYYDVDLIFDSVRFHY